VVHLHIASRSGRRTDVRCGWKRLTRRWRGRASKIVARARRLQRLMRPEGGSAAEAVLYAVSAETGRKGSPA
jgi:hypothetical protein